MNKKRLLKNLSVGIIGISSVASTISIASCSLFNKIVGKEKITCANGGYRDDIGADRYQGIGSGGSQYSVRNKEKVAWTIESIDETSIDPYISVYSLNDYTCMLTWYNLNEVKTWNLVLKAHKDGKEFLKKSITLDIVDNESYITTDFDDYWDNLSNTVEDIFTPFDFTPHYPQQNNYYFNHPETWMSGLDENTKVGDVNIPATHDSACQYVEQRPGSWESWNMIEGWSDDHDYSIEQALNAGVRMLDLRWDSDFTPNYDPSNPLSAVMIHNVAMCYKDEARTIPLTAEDCLKVIVDFLNHPSKNKETIFLQIENSKNANKQDLLDWVAKYTGKPASEWFYNGTNQMTKDTKLSDINSLSDQHGHLAWGWNDNDYPGKSNFTNEQSEWFANITNEINWNRMSWQIPFKLNDYLTRWNYETEMYHLYQIAMGVGTDNVDTRVEMSLNCNAWDPRYYRNSSQLSAEFFDKTIINQDWSDDYIGKKLGWIFFDTKDSVLEDDTSIAKKIYLTNILTEVH